MQMMTVHRGEVVVTAKPLDIEIYQPSAWVLSNAASLQCWYLCVQTQRGSSMGMSPRYIRVQILGLLTLLFASASYTIAQAAQPTISDFRVTLRGTFHSQPPA